jgi:DNA-binding MarR family transcriptional regulator
MLHGVLMLHGYKHLNIAGAGKKVKSPHHRLLCHLRAICDRQGRFELNAATIAQHLGLSRRSVYLAIAALERQGLVARVHFRTGRGRHSVYQLRIEQKSKPREIDEKIVKKKCAKTGIRNIKNIQHTLKTAPARLGGGSTPRRDPTAYQGPEAARVVLVMGARFYRHAMRQTRLGLESWELPEPIRHALEGLIGNRFDGMTLADARGLVAKIWAMRAEIEALARSGASPRRVCAFVAGRLSGKPDRSRREVLRRTAELIRQTLDPELIARRIQGLRRFAAEREAEYQAGQVCRRCGYRHTQIEYETGYRDDGTGELSCFGWVRIKQEELHEARKLAERRQRELHCRHCGGSLREGHVEGLCWSCYPPPSPKS